jgi:methylmalonyl-CoA/ethylmalonyl-CoA epimerase
VLITFVAMEHLLRIEHLGIAVKDLAAAEALYTSLLGVGPYKREAVESEGVITSFFRTGPNKIELLESTRPDGPIARAIEKRGEGIHHVAFEVADIRAEMDRLKAAGFQLLNEEPKRGADNKWVCFIHPKSTNGVLLELCQEIPAAE